MPIISAVFAAQLRETVATLRRSPPTADAVGAYARAVILQCEGRSGVADGPVEDLARRFEGRLRHLLGKLEAESARLLEVRDGMALADAIVCDYLRDELGDEGGAEIAEQLAATARESWAGFEREPDWTSFEGILERWRLTSLLEGITVFGALLWALWLSEVRRPGGLAQEPVSQGSASVGAPATAEPKYPAVAAGVLERIRRAYWAKGREIRVGRQVVLDGAVVGYLRATGGRSVPNSLDIGATGSLVAHRLLRWLVAEVRRQIVRTSTVAEARTVIIEGGFPALAVRLGSRSAKAAATLRAVLDVTQHLHLELLHGETAPLLTWEWVKAARGRQAEIRITAGDALLPSYVTTAPKARQSQREGKMLVPFPEELPPMVGHLHHHGAVAAFQTAVLGEFRVKAEVLEEYEVIRLDERKVCDLARQVGLDEELARAAIERWVQPDGFLERDEESPVCYGLAPALGGAQEVLHEGARASARGRARAAASIRSRRRRRST